MFLLHCMFSYSICCEAYSQRLDVYSEARPTVAERSSPFTYSWLIGSCLRDQRFLEEHGWPRHTFRGRSSALYWGQTL